MADKAALKERIRELIEDYTADGFVRVLKQACAPALFTPIGKDCSFEIGGEKTEIRVLGVVKDLPDENGFVAPLLVADVPLTTVLTERTSRVRQFKLARKALEHFGNRPPMELDGVIAQGVFVFHDEEGCFRVSLVTATPEGGKFNWSKARRQSFYVTNDPDANATFIQRMGMSWCTLKDVKEVFSVEKLTNEFYNELFKWYDRACEDERVEYPNGLDTDADNREDKNRKHLLRLVTRLMFVWFLKQKGLVPEKLFDEKELKGVLKGFNPVSCKQHQYYRAILQNLFFATLNSEIEDRAFVDAPRARSADGKVTTRHYGVKTKYRYADEFAISKKEVLELFGRIPFLNGGLFECLDQENEDGKVMYYDGFSQQEHHRDLGTLTWAHVPNDLFFSPDYGIIPLLKRFNFTVEENSPGDEDVALDPELLGKVFENLLGAFNPETQEAVRKSTGSFYTPREIVNYMVDESLIAYLAEKTKTDEKTVRALVADGERPADEAVCKQLAGAVESAKIIDPACGSGAFPMGALLKMTELLRILEKLSEDANLYDLKLRLIENCIFGVDIQEIAVQISKLRVFISLVCEQKPDYGKQNYGINTLPNLETKFVAANSLIGLEKEAQGDLFFDSDKIQKTKDALWDVRHRHFLAKTRREKNELRREDKELRTKLAIAVKEIGYSENSTRLMASWDPYNQNVHAEFFDSEWMFNVKDGFDIVIGNPPYRLCQRSNTEQDLLEAYKKYQVASYKIDLFHLFYEMGLGIASTKGVISYITANTYLTNKNTSSLRRYILDNSRILRLVVYPNEVFDSACVEVATIFLLKESTKNLAHAVPIYLQDGTGIRLINTLLQEDWRKDVTCAFNIKKPPVSIAIDCVALGKVCNTYFGIQAYDKKSSTSERKRNDKWLPIVDGSDVVHYGCRSARNYFHFVPSEIKSGGDEQVYAQDRVLVRQIGMVPFVGYVGPGVLTSNTVYNVYVTDDRFSIKYVLAILSSSYIKYLWGARYSDNKKLFPKIKGYQLRELPIPNVGKEQQDIITSKVEQVLAIKEDAPDADTSALEREIDKLVYRLYGLTDDEIAIVEKASARAVADAEAEEPARASRKKRKQKIEEEF